MPVIHRFSQHGQEVYFNGVPVKLAGVYAGVVGSTTDSLDAPFDDDMLRLTQNENNFTRHIVTPYWKYSPVAAINQRNCAFVRQGAKWNIQSYNADYFARLKSMIDTAADNGIVVQIVLFDRTGLDVTNPGEGFRRWDDCPWNKSNNVNGVIQADPAPQPYSGLPEFYRNDLTLRSIQEAYIRYVVAQTRSWNVFYEIMNEPMGGTADDRVGWADWVVSIINSATGGGQLIFYNDHNPALGAHGADVARWKQIGGNYSKFHGVILHGVPTSFTPGNAAYASWSADKIFQVSSDTAPADKRETAPDNAAWCKYAFDNKMIFQAHTNSPNAASGIKQNHPTPIVPIMTDPVGGGGRLP
ncbi:MAG: hypothetical protein QOJ76_2577 [Acidobacteriota bacterium]|nr:hypothetical protein [Acidobacteriota bacterium]